MQLQTELEAFRHSASVSDPTAQRLPLNHSTDDQGERSDSLDKPEDLLAVALLTSQLTESKERMKALESEYQLQIAELKAQIHHAADDTGKITQVSFKLENIEELKSRNFSLDEQVRDLKIQLAQKQVDCSRMSEELMVKSSELENLRNTFEEKLKKLKGLFAVANKNLADQKEIIAKYENERVAHQESSENLRQKLISLESALISSQDAHRQTASENLETISMLKSKINDAQIKHEKTCDELTQIKVDFQTYKKRAHAVLASHKPTDDLERKVSQLEQMLMKAEKANSDLSKESDQVKSKFSVLENSWNEAVDHNNELETRLRELEDENNSIRNELAKSELNSNAARLKEEEKSNLIVSELSKKHREELEALSERNSRLISSKEDEIADLQRITEQLNVDLTDIRDQLSKLKLKYEQTNTAGTKSAEKISPPPQSPRKDSMMMSFSQISGEELKSPSNLLATHEREYQQKINDMAELLRDGENEIQRLRDQERVLKEEIRKIDRSDKRKNINMEYLKNIILRFIEATDRDALLPVISQILFLSSEEAESAKKALSRQRGWII